MHSGPQELFSIAHNYGRAQPEDPKALVTRLRLIFTLLGILFCLESYNTLVNFRRNKALFTLAEANSPNKENIFNTEQNSFSSESEFVYTNQAIFVENT